MGKVSLTRHIRNLRGGSQPILAQGSDGLLYVVKFTNNPQGANVCFNESAGSELYRAFGLNSPAWKPLLVTDSFLEQNPSCWMQTGKICIRPESGLCFGSRFLDGDGRQPLEILPGTCFRRIHKREHFWLAWLIDICCEHADNRQAIFLQDPMRGLDAFFVDHGHLFRGPNGKLKPKIKTCSYLDARVYESVCSHYLQGLRRAAACLNVDRLWKRIQALPDNWKTPSAADAFAQCLCRFSSSHFVQSTLDVMMETQESTHGSESRRCEIGRKPPGPVLHLGIQTTGFGHRARERRAYTPCA